MYIYTNLIYVICLWNYLSKNKKRDIKEEQNKNNWTETLNQSEIEDKRKRRRKLQRVPVFILSTNKMDGEWD